MRPLADAAYKRVETVSALMSTDEKDSLHKFAQTHGQTMSQVIRESVAIYIEAETSPHLRRRRRRLLRDI